MDSEEVQPSGCKKQKTGERWVDHWKRNRPLTADEIEQHLLASDEDTACQDCTESDEYDSSKSDLGELVDSADYINVDPAQGITYGNSTQIINTGEILWTNTKKFQKFPFTRRCELKVPPAGSKPIDYFNLLVDDNFYNMVSTESNIYAAEILQSEKTTEHSRITRWHDTDVVEFRIFFGLLLHMGTIQLSRLQDYWKQDCLFNIPVFSRCMSRDRFMLIMRCLHFATNPKEADPKPVDRFYRIRPVINYFNNKMLEIYYPDKNLSLGESMILWRGKLLFHQYVKKKCHKHGIKLYMLTEPDGTIIKFFICTGALDDYGGEGHCDKIVLHLMEEKLNAGHSLFMDNFYNSYDLAVKLLGQNTYCTGTLRLDRKNCPSQVKEKKLKPYEAISVFSNGVMVGKWQNKRDISFISTEFSGEMQKYTNKRQQEKEKPLAIYMYNKYMGGIDKQDEMLSYYPCSRKVLMWYKKLGTHIFQMLLLNSFFLFKKYERSKMSLYDFRLQIIKELLAPKIDKVPVSVPGTLTHIPVKNPLGANNKRPHRRCGVCSKKKIRSETVYFCPACPEKPALCIGSCFNDFHKN